MTDTRREITRADIHYMGVECGFCNDHEVAAICRAGLDGNKTAWAYVAADVAHMEPEEFLSPNPPDLSFWYARLKAGGWRWPAIEPVGHAGALANVITICGIERVVSDTAVGR